MRKSKFILCLAPTLALAACSDDSGVVDQGPPEAAALVRFVNVNVDTGTVDLKFIDKIENLPTMSGVPARSASGMYQRVIPGTRAARVFPSPTNDERLLGKSLALAQTILVDRPVNVTADQRYTLVYAGRAGTNQATLAELQDPVPPTPATGNIAIKVLNAAFGTGAVDVYIVPVASTTATTPADFSTVNAGKVSNVGYLQQSAYVTLPARPTTGTPLYRFVVTAAGSTTELFAVTPNQPGTPTPAGQIYGPQPGVQISGSVMTAVLAPAQVAGTRLATSTTPTVFLIPDKVLNP